MKNKFLLVIIAMATIGGVIAIPEQTKEKSFSTVEVNENQTEMEEKDDNKGFAEDKTQKETSETKIQTESTIPEKKVEEHKIEKPVVENKTTTSTKDEVVVDNSSIVSASPPTEEKVETEVPKQNVEEEKMPEETEKTEVDLEYQNLLSQVEYSTYEECLNAGFDIAFSDTVNILGFDPIEIIYKGQVIGYKLKIHYTNPMEN